MIEFIKVSKSYDKNILENLSFKLESGANLGIFGKSGIGKTTILKLILALEEADSGEIIRDYKKASVLFQENRLIEEISALDNIKLIGKDQKKSIESLEKFGITDYRKKVSSLSGGMQRKVALARAYVYNGDILILDEPFLGIDRASSIEISKILKEKYEGKSIILVSHHMDDFPLFDIGNNQIIYL